MLGLILLTVAFIAIIMLAMSVGILTSNRCLRGSCGGPEVLDADGTPLTCDTCPLRRQPGGPDAPTSVPSDRL
jgi:hypothetical protein